jgi:putative transcriptional regulator
MTYEPDPLYPLKREQRMNRRMKGLKDPGRTACIPRGGQITNSVRAHRLTRGRMSQRLLAELSGVCLSTISLIETQGRGTQLYTAFRIAHALGARVEDLFHVDVHHSGSRVCVRD